MADKMQRLNIVAPIIKRKRVYVPESSVKEGFVRDWAEPMISQLCAFPEVRHDDLVDATTQALRILRDMGFLDIDPVYNDESQYIDETKPRRTNPYAV